MSISNDIQQSKKTGRPKGSRDKQKTVVLEQLDANVNRAKGVNPGVKGRPKGSTNRRVKSADAISRVGDLPSKNGRPLTTIETRKQFMDLVRKSAGKALKVLLKIIDDPDSSDKHKITAAKEILDRAYGKAPTAVINIDADSGSDEQKKLVVEFVKTHLDVRDEVKSVIIDHPPIIEVNPIEDTPTDNFDRTNIVEMPFVNPASGR